MEGNVLNLLVLPDIGGFHQYDGLSVDEFFFKAMSNFAKTPSVSEDPQRKGLSPLIHSS